VPVDNDIGLFFRSLATEDWDDFDTAAAGGRVTGSNGKSTTTALIHHILDRRQAAHADGRQHRARRAGP
jgi:UDP-N-acetylmuramoylalanine--D-glutamate ligase